MESLIDIGLVRSLGISNFNCSIILDLLRYARIRPATLQIEHHPYLVQQPLVDFATKEGITITAYSSFGPQGYVEMDLEHAVKTPHLFQNPVVNEIAKAHGKSAPQVLLRWATQQGIAVIPKSDTLPMLLDNLNAKGFDLTGEEIKKISGLDQHLRFNNPLVVHVFPSPSCYFDTDSNSTSDACQSLTEKFVVLGFVEFDVAKLGVLRKQEIVHKLMLLISTTLYIEFNDPLSVSYRSLQPMNSNTFPLP